MFAALNHSYIYVGEFLFDDILSWPNSFWLLRNVCFLGFSIFFTKKLFLIQIILNVLF